MFTRNDESYNISKIEYQSPNSPLYQISQMIPNGSKVLDIGAGNGILGRMFKEKQVNIIIDGIEPNLYASELAKIYYRKFYTGYAQNYFDIICHEDYDYIVLADVIEHIADPYEFLKKLVSFISFKTKIIISIPNISFGAVRLAILNGNFDYSDSGLIEKTHLRFFTLKTILTLLSKCKINIEKIIYLQRSIFNSEIKIEILKINPFILHNIKKDPLSYTYQFLLILTKKSCVSENILVGEVDKHLYLKYLIKRHRNIYLFSSLLRILQRIKSIK